MKAGIIQIGIVDDKAINRTTVMRKLETYAEAKIVLEAGNGEDFLVQMQEMNRADHPKVVLMDLDMPVMDGIETIRNATIIYPDIRFVVLTIFEDTDRIFEAIKAGASGYLLKDDKAINIMDAIINVVNYNGVPMSPVIARKAMTMMLNQDLKKEETPVASSLGLTPREIELLSELANGSTYIEIGEKLFISPLTVRKHVANLYAKLHAKNRLQIISIAQKNNLI